MSEEKKNEPLVENSEEKTYELSRVLRFILVSSFILLNITYSADVGVIYDPIYASVSDRTNCAYSAYGISFDKYTGSRGKAGGSDANAEFIGKLRELLERHNIQYQFAELGRVDVGGGGTIAYILANKGVEVIDCGVPVLSMHSPYEVASKYDIYSAYKTYKIFYEEI